MRNYLFAFFVITQSVWSMETPKPCDEKKEIGKKSDLLFPLAIAPHVDIAFFHDWRKQEQYLSTLDDPKQITPQRPLCTHDKAATPALSPDGAILIGWTKEPFMREQFCCITTYFGALNQRIKWSEHRRIGWLHYAFLPNGMLIFRDNRSLYECTVEDLVKNGEEALLKVHTRNDTREYPFALYYKALHVFSDSIISCIGPDEKSFEILEKKSKSQWDVSRVSKTAHIVQRVVYAPSSMLIATREQESNNHINFYQLDGSSKTGAIDIESLAHDFNAAFSPNAQYFACGTEKDRGEIDIIDCSNLKELSVYATISVSPNLPIIGILWNSKGLYAEDGHPNRYDIDASLITGYKDKKLAKEESNNNNA